VFNIGGNKVRLIAAIRYNRKKIYIRAVLTHAEYDEGRWKARLIRIFAVAHRREVYEQTAELLRQKSKVNRLLRNSDSRLFKKVQMRGAREIDERRRIY
jgi:hypothetical protein